MDIPTVYLRPRPLKLGDRLAIISPASPPNPVEIFGGLTVIRNCGLEPVLGDNLRYLRSRGLCSASLKDRVDEFVWAWQDDSIAGILIATGGFGSAQLLPHIPWELCRTKVKPLMGFSDVTALNNALLRKAGVASFHGPSATIRKDAQGGHLDCDVTSLKDALELLLDPQPWEGRPFLRNEAIPRCVCRGRVSGPAIGGNLTTFACLLGTEFLPELHGAILFLEDIDEGGYELKRTLTHLDLAGVFDKVAGVVIGEFARAPTTVDTGDPSIEDVLVDFFSNGPPTVVGFNFSHGDITGVIPIGVTTHLDAQECILAFDNPFCS